MRTKVGLIRLHKLMSERGVCSRREAEKWIRQGRVQINQKMITRLGTLVDPDKDRILIDGHPLPKTPKKIYIAFHKPRHVMVTRRDPEGRPTLYDYLKKIPQQILPVGRLDFESEGLLLLTNDNPLIDKLTHPRSKVPRAYEAHISPCLKPEQIEILQNGVLLEDGRTLPTRIKMRQQTPHSCRLHMTLFEGRYRQIRRMIAQVGGEVKKLRRIQMGPLHLKNLKQGHYRHLTSNEIDALIKK